MSGVETSSQFVQRDHLFYNLVVIVAQDQS
jgi:hypothetical protein